MKHRSWAPDGQAGPWTTRGGVGVLAPPAFLS